GRIVGAMRRIAPEGDWRTNVARGGEVEDVTDDLSEKAKRLAIRATDVLGLGIAGVDLYPVDDSWQILEVNATAGFKGLFSATGRSAAPYIAQLALAQTETEVADEAVMDLAGTLDDSVPECKPTRSRDEPEDPVLGYTSRVKISGADAMESAVAKADTGAKRTSIDMELAGRIGAGPIIGTTEVRSGISVDTEIRSLVEIEIAVNGAWQSVTANITDRRRMNYPVLLGRDVLQDYTLDISERVEE
ncbi:MAG: RimK/LysX family protein, partial [Halobacteriales archaeon]